MTADSIKRWCRGLAAPLVAVLVYVALYHTVPGFSANTRALFGLIPEPPASKVIRRQGRTYLWAGDDPRSHFDVTDGDLSLERLNFGLGREHFPALRTPRFVLARDVRWVPDTGRVIAVDDGGLVKLFPISVLKTHEVVNDIIDGEPVFVAYCALAGLGAVYDRRVGDATLTFGVSGYTYSDPDVWGGYDAFVLWDRESESLWWPPVGAAVTGPLRGVPLLLYDETCWSQTTWQEALAAYPDAVVLDRFQRPPIPDEWPSLSRADVGAVAERADIAPPWGENDALETGGGD